MLPCLTLALTSGLLLGSFIPYFPLSISFILCLAAIGSSLAEAHYRGIAARAGAIFVCLLLGIAYWFVAVERGAKAPFKELEIAEEFRGRIISPVQLAPERMVMVVRLDPTMDRANHPLVVRLTWRAPERVVFQGDRIAARAKLRAPNGSLNPGGFDYSAYLERQGIDATATISGADAVTLVESGLEDTRWRFWNHVDRWRARIRLAAIRSLSQPALGLYLGIIIGERGYLDQNLRDHFMVTGTVHLLSISGSHLGLVAVLVFMFVKQALLRLLPPLWLLRLSRRITPTRLAALATVLPVTAYACLAGAELATVRSLIMIIVALMATWLGHEQRMFHALSVAAVVMLLHDPQTLYDISFQLSFLSVCAIAWWLSRAATAKNDGTAVRPLRLLRVIQWAADAFAMSAVVTLTTLPLVAFYFNQIPWLGVVGNLLAVPVMGAFLVPLGLASALWTCLLQRESLAMTVPIQWSLDHFVGVLEKASALPGGEWHVASPAGLSMLLFYGCLAAIWLRPDRKTILWMAGTGLVLVISWWVWSPRLLLDGDRFRVTFLDVSQGDSAVLELPGGQVVLIDGGATYERFDMGRGVVAPYLWNRGIRTIDHVVATHPQLDHVGGLAYILEHFRVEHFWGTGDTREEPFYHRLRQALALKKLEEEKVESHQDLFVSGDCRLRVLNPAAAAEAQAFPSGRKREGGHELNNRSIVLKLDCGTHRMLFTADVEREALWRMSQEGRPDRIDVVKVPHHGAKSSFERQWLEQVNPRYAVVSVGRHNPYGHPDQHVLEEYAQKGTFLYRTDRDGGIWVTGKRSDPVVTIHRTSEEKLRRIPFANCLLACERANWRTLFMRYEE